MKNNYVTIIDSWKLNARNEILADIQHSLDGLVAGTVLNSLQTNLKWKIVSRVLFSQVKNQKRFKGEKEHHQHFSFKAPIVENLENFINTIIQNEAQHIFHYAIEPIGHTNKPNAGEKLEVLYSG